MAIPFEHKEKVTTYFAAVETIKNKLKQDLLNNGLSEYDITLSETNILLQANAMAKALLGYSYYPWPFAVDESDVVGPNGETNV